MIHVNRSISLYATDVNSKGTNPPRDALVNPAVAAGYVFLAFQADFLPLPLNWDVASEPEKALKRAKHELFPFQFLGRLS